MHKYPRRWQYVKPGYLARRAKPKGKHLPWGVQCEIPGGILHAISEDGTPNRAMTVSEAHAERQAASGEYREVFDHHDPKSAWQAGDNIKNRMAIVFLKGLIKELKDEHLKQIATLKAENLELQMKLSQHCDPITTGA